MFVVADTSGYIEAEHKLDLSPALAPMAAAICGMPRANSGVTWLRSNPKIAELLRGLADGSIEISHDALDALPPSRSVEYIRGLLVANNGLPPRDRFLATFERWLQTKLATVPDGEQRQLVERFARWHHLRNLRRQIRGRPEYGGNRQ